MNIYAESQFPQREFEGVSTYVEMISAEFEGTIIQCDQSSPKKHKLWRYYLHKQSTHNGRRGEAQWQSQDFDPRELTSKYENIQCIFYLQISIGGRIWLFIERFGLIELTSP